MYNVLVHSMYTCTVHSTNEIYLQNTQSQRIFYRVFEKDIYIYSTQDTYYTNFIKTIEYRVYTKTLLYMQYKCWVAFSAQCANKYRSPMNCNFSLFNVLFCQLVIHFIYTYIRKFFFFYFNNTFLSAIIQKGID